MICFVFGTLKASYPGLASPMEVVVSGRSPVRDGHCWRPSVVREPSFPVVELAGALRNWKSHPPADRADFEFESMDFEEPGLVWFRREGGGWRVGSLLQEFPDVATYAADELDRAIDAYIAELEAAAIAELDLDLAAVWDYLASA